MREKNLVPATPAVIKQNRNLLEGHPCGLAALYDSDAHDLVFPVSPAARCIAVGLQESDRFPVPQHISGQFESLGDLSDGPWMLRT